MKKKEMMEGEVWGLLFCAVVSMQQEKKRERCRNESALLQ
jgi:hypothetical protein